MTKKKKKTKQKTGEVKLGVYTKLCTTQYPKTHDQCEIWVAKPYLPQISPGTYLLNSLNRKEEQLGRLINGCPLHFPFSFCTDIPLT